MRLGWPEILLILVVVMIVFGVGKLPQTMKDVGKGIREFRKAQQGDYDDQKNGAKPLAAASSAGNGAGDASVVVAESHGPTSMTASQQSTEDELAEAKERLQAAEARVRELEKNNKKA